MSGSRSRALDLARALAILSMVAYHFSYDWFVVLGGDGGWPGRWYIHLWQQSICWTFILVSGACGHFGRHPLKKGLILNLCGLLITAVTVVALPSQAVWFGVLNCSPPPTIFKAAGWDGRGWGFSCPPSGTRARCW